MGTVPGSLPGEGDGTTRAVDRQQQSVDAQRVRGGAEPGRVRLDDAHLADGVAESDGEPAAVHSRHEPHDRAGHVRHICAREPAVQVVARDRLARSDDYLSRPYPCDRRRTGLAALAVGRAAMHRVDDLHAPAASAIASRPPNGAYATAAGWCRPQARGRVAVEPAIALCTITPPRAVTNANACESQRQLGVTGATPRATGKSWVPLP